MDEEELQKRRELEDRLDRIVTIYETFESFMESLPDEIPSRVKEWALERIVEDEELSELINDIKNRRAPRLILVGRTGSGKSSLINAICGQYLAEISDVDIGTEEARKYSYESFGKTIFEVIDTRGFGEGEDDRPARESALQSIREATQEFDPDAILFLQKADERGYRQQDVDCIREIQETGDRDLPVIGICSQVDKLEPSREKDPDNYSDRKKKNIEEAADQLEKDLENEWIDVLDVIPVSSYLEWERDPTEIESSEERERLSIRFDGRYNIDHLIDVLEDNIDFEAGITLLMAARLDRVAREISDRFIRNFALISGMVGTTPIPVSDILILTPMQITLIMLVAYLAGRELSFETARELLTSIGVAAPAGFGLKMIFQQGSKLANLLYPGAGSALSGSIAAGGTYGIGKASKAYFFRGASREELKQIAEEASEEFDEEIPDPDFTDAR